MAAVERYGDGHEQSVGHLTRVIVMGPRRATSVKSIMEPPHDAVVPSEASPTTERTVAPTPSSVAGLRAEAKPFTPGAIPTTTFGPMDATNQQQHGGVLPHMPPRHAVTVTRAHYDEEGNVMYPARVSAVQNPDMMRVIAERDYRKGYREASRKGPINNGQSTAYNNPQQMCRFTGQPTAATPMFAVFPSANQQHPVHHSDGATLMRGGAPPSTLAAAMRDPTVNPPPKYAVYNPFTADLSGMHGDDAQEGTAPNKDNVGGLRVDNDTEGNPFGFLEEVKRLAAGGNAPIAPEKHLTNNSTSAVTSPDSASSGVGVELPEGLHASDASSSALSGAMLNLKLSSKGRDDERTPDPEDLPDPIGPRKHFPRYYDAQQQQQQLQFLLQQQHQMQQFAGMLSNNQLPVPPMFGLPLPTGGAVGPNGALLPPSGGFPCPPGMPAAPSGGGGFQVTAGAAMPPPPPPPYMAHAGQGTHRNQNQQQHGMPLQAFVPSLSAKPWSPSSAPAQRNDASIGSEPGMSANTTLASGYNGNASSEDDVAHRSFDDEGPRVVESLKINADTFFSVTNTATGGHGGAHQAASGGAYPQQRGHQRPPSEGTFSLQSLQGVRRAEAAMPLQQVVWQKVFFRDAETWVPPVFPPIPDETVKLYNGAKHYDVTRPLTHPQVALHLYQYRCMSCPITVYPGKINHRPADVKLGGVCGDVPALCIGHMIEIITGVKIAAIDMFGNNLGRCNIWLEDPSDVAVLTRKFDRKMWMSPVFHGYAVVALDDEGREFLHWYLEGLRAYGPKAVRFPRHLVTCERWIA